MSLSAGTRLGQYEILGPIGAGGMGEVYRARDTKLKRDVALKVLPDTFADDPDRMARFQREAEVLASLNHPNIAHIYGVEDHALVMELVEGVEPKGPLPFDEAWNLAVQITAALEYAHDKGVIHRDLKPANVKVTPAGVVKLLDFGLAKAISSESSEAQVEARASDSPTLTMAPTVAGMILGTAAYMAPEQVKGKRVDKRIDIWSWGVVLYELLTGERMFQGDDAAETLAQVLTKQPNLERVPANVRRLLGECLQKDPKLRLRDIGDANRLIADEDTSATAPSRSPLAWIAAAALAIALVGLSFVHFREAPPERPRVRFQITPSEKSRLLDFQLSPNGRFLAFVTEGERMADERLWIRALDSLDSRALLQTGRVIYPFWSPNGEYIAFFSQGQLRRVPMRGGPPVVVCDVPVGGVSGGAWLRDDVIIFTSNSTREVFRVPATGGTPSKVSAPPASFAPQVLTGEKFLVTSPDGIWIGSLDGAKPIRILPDVSSSTYVPPSRPGLTGYVLFVRGDTLMAQVFDGIKGKLREEIFPIAEQVGNLGGLGVATRRAFSASTNGVLVFASGNSVDRELAWVDRAGKRLETATKPFAMPRNPAIALSPDDTEIAVPVADRSGADYWVADLTRKTFSRFTFDGSRSALWSPDGKRLLFAKNDGNRFLKAADGSGKEELVFKNPTCPTCYLYDWSLDGKLIAFTQPGDKGANIWLVSTDGDHKPYPYRGSHFNETWARFSPDGRWMAYETDESGERQIYAESIPAGNGRRQISTDGGQWPRWRRDGKELFYRQGNKMMAVPIRLTATSVEASKPQVLFESNDDLRFEVSHDGQRFLLSFPIEGQTAFTPITVDTNWQAGQAK